MKAVGIDILRLFAVSVACFAVMEGWIAARAACSRRALAGAATTATDQINDLERATE